MAEKVALEVTANSSQAESSVKSLKAQLREAQADVAKMADKFGETSAQAVQAAKRAAELKDRIGDAKAMTEAFNPDKKFQAFSSALQGVVGGFTAVQGAMGLFGAESEDVQKTLLKVQSAMAMLQGLNAVTESIDAFKVLGAKLSEVTIIQKASAVAQRIWNAAMSANPIGTIVVAVTALIAGLVSLVSWFKKSSDAAKEQANAVAETNKQLTNQKKLLEEHAAALDRSNKQQLAMAKASGMSAAKMRELEISLINKKVADAQASSVAALHTVELEKQTLATLKSKGANEEVIKAQEENVKKAREILTTANENVVKAGNERIDIINRQQVDIAQAETDANKKRLEKLKEHHKKVLEENKKVIEETKKLNDENYLKLITDENKRAKAKLELDKANAIDEVNKTLADRNLKNQQILAIEQKYLIDLKALKDAQYVKDTEDRAIKNQEELATKGIHQNNLTSVEVAEVPKRVAVTQAEYEAKVAIYTQMGNVIGQLSDVIGKSTGVGKALALAQIAIDTGVAISALTRNSQQNPANAITGGVAGALQFAAGLVQILANIKKAKEILSTAKVPGGGGGGGGGNSMPSVSAPIAPQMSQTALNQQMINQVGNAATRAFVVESDVSGSQERIRRLNRAARIN